MQGIDSIPNIDLRETYPLGEPYVPPPPKSPRRKTDVAQAVSITIYATVAIGALIFAGVIIAVCGPIVGLLIIFGFIAKLKI